MTETMIQRGQLAISALPRQPRDSEQEYYWRRLVVKTVIEAMREPTEGMQEEALRYLRTESQTNVWTAWQAMIEDALQDGEAQDS